MTAMGQLPSGLGGSRVEYRSFTGPHKPFMVCSANKKDPQLILGIVVMCPFDLTMIACFRRVFQERYSGSRDARHITSLPSAREPTQHDLNSCNKTPKSCTYRPFAVEPHKISLDLTHYLDALWIYRVKY